MTVSRWLWVQRVMLLAQVVFLVLEIIHHNWQWVILCWACCAVVLVANREIRLIHRRELGGDK